MSANIAFPGVREADVATINTGGVFYRCYTYASADDKTIRAKCFIEQEQGQEVLLFDDIVYTESASFVPESPKIVAHGDIFVIHWLEASDKIGRGWLDITARNTVTAWTLETSFSVHADGLFDVHEMVGSTDYVMAWKETIGPSVQVVRYNGTGFANIVWDETTAITPINCLGVYGSHTDDIVVAAFQETNVKNIRTLRRVGADGTGAATGTLFSTSPMTTYDYTNVGICRLSASISIIAAECVLSGAASGFRSVAYAKMANTTAARSLNEHHIKNVHLYTRPWSYADHDGGANPDVYCVLSYKTYDDPNDWEQKNFYVVNMDAIDWSKAANTVRPRPIATMNMGTADARPAVIKNVGPAANPQRRNNHLSHLSGAPTSGPNVKTRTFAAIAWTRMITQQSSLTESELEPSGAMVVGYRCHMEDVWSYYRDTTDPVQPTSNFKGPYTLSAFQNAEVGRTLLIAGGTPSTYDGTSVVELGFCWYPEMVLADFSSDENDPGNLIPDGIYSWVATYEWRDASGQIHRSAPSRPFIRTLVNLTNPGLEQSVTMGIRCINLSAKEGAAYPNSPGVDIVLWRTDANGSIFYRVHGDVSAWTDGGIENTGKNDPTAHSVLVVDNRSNTSLVLQDVLPWQLSGGAWFPLEPLQPPANPVITSWQNRAWMAGGEDPNSIWYSQEVLPEQGGVLQTVPEFHPALVYKIDESSGITGMQPMDSGMVVFSRDQIFILNGFGADGTGSNSSLSHQLIAVGTGCIEPRSIVLGPDGVFFQSEKGYHIVTRTLEVDYLSAGADVEDIFRNAGNIRAANLVEDKHEIRLVLNEAVDSGYSTLTYNYLWKQWTRGTFAATHSDAWQSAHVGGTMWRGHTGELAHVILTGSTLMIERESGATAFIDSTSGADAAVNLAVQTGWLKVAGMSGFKRVRRIIIQTEKPQASEVSCLLEYEVDGKFNGDLNETVTWASPAPEALEIRPSVQKFTAVRIKIFEPSTVPQTENISIQSITMEVGLKQGARKLAPARVGK